jgi:hypothetical protein
MPISPRCEGCGGEDCCCCEVWLEEQSDLRAQRENPPEFDEFDDFEEPYDEEDEEEDCLDDGPNEDMDGDFDTAMRDAGRGTDEDYGCFDSGDGDW